MSQSEIIRNRILTQIKSGELKPHTRLPSRHALMNTYNIARATADSIILQLRDAGFLYSSKGSGTYVAPPSAEKNRHVFVVSDIHSEFNSSSFAGRLSAELRAPDRFSIIYGHDIETAFPRLARDGARVIWYCPPQKYYYLVDKLNAACIPQILVNRFNQRYNHIATDTNNGLGMIFERLDPDKKRYSWTLLLPPMNPAVPFRAEREIFFFQNAAAHAIVPSRIVRVENDTNHALLKAITALLSESRVPAIVFIPEQTYIGPFLAMAHERGLVMGGDLRIIMTDHVRSLSSTDGIFSLEQPWDTMEQTAITWALKQQPEPLQVLLLPRLHIS